MGSTESITLKEEVEEGDSLGKRWRKPGGKGGGVGFNGKQVARSFGGNAAAKKQNLS